MNKFLDWLSNFYRTEYILTPLAIDKWANPYNKDCRIEIYIFGIRIFVFRRW